MTTNKIISATFILIAIAGAAFFLMRPKETTPAATIEEPTDLSKLLIEDKTILQGTATNTTPERIRDAILRVARSKDSLGQEFALQNLENSHSLIRGASAEALGYYDDNEILASLTKVLDDPDRTVRMAAMRGFSHQKTEERIAELKKYETKIRDDKTIAETEKTALFEALSRIAGEQEKKRYVSELVKKARAFDNDTGTEATYLAANLAPNDSAVIELLRDRIKASKDVNMVTVAVRHLAAVKDMWLSKELETLIKSESPKIRQATLMGALDLCSSNIESLVSSAKNDSDVGVKDALKNVERELSSGRCNKPPSN